MRLLVVEDKEKLALALQKGLKQENYAVDVCFDGMEGLNMALSIKYDLLILDRMLPSLSGIQIVQNVRAKKIQTPIIFLTAKDTISDRIEGLDVGADDYIVKPFSFDELLARVRALLRRPHDTKSNILKYEDLSLDIKAFKVTRGSKTINLTNKEFALLEYLMRNPNKPHSKEQIIEHVWSFDSEILPNNVEVFIGYLRNKIDKPFPDETSLINTKRGFGYILGES
ncbi:MAG TPA: response regulator transcription factor [Candidatus Saccharibacteria bacterium]|nr:response regulator transcription factor [Candidatus Saccharibacteria bacterium]